MTHHGDEHVDKDDDDDSMVDSKQDHPHAVHHDGVGIRVDHAVRVLVLLGIYEV